MMNNVFKYHSDAERFTQYGFLRKKLLDELTVVKLNNLYHQSFPEGSENFYSSTFVKDIEKKKRLNDSLISILDPIIQQHFSDYKTLGAQFLVKNQGQGGHMPFHQDWTVVDEDQFRSITVWVSLNETNETNGAIKVVPSSHEFSRYKRGPGNFDHLKDIQDTLDKLAHTLYMKAGEAFIFDQSIIHGSNKNESDKPRIAVAFGLVHKDADLIFYHQKEKDTFQKFRVKDDFFITFSNEGEAPLEAELLEVIQQKSDRIKSDEFIQRMDEINHQRSLEFTPQPLFSDSTIQEKFDRDGFVMLSLLNDDEVNTLKKYYLSLNHDHVKDYGFHISLENKSADYRNGVFKILFDTIIPKLSPFLLNYQAFTASYVIKEAGLENIVPPHQDWSFVDETEFCSATVWIPLMDVNKNNGALGIIRGSHKLFNFPRASPSPQAKSLLSDHVFNLFPYVEVIDMKAGEALIFNNKTIHASPPNISGKSRIAAGIGITQKEARLRHYYQLPGNEERIEVYEVEPAFFPLYNNSRMSEYYNANTKPNELKAIESFKKIAQEFSKEEITQLICTTPGVKFNNELMEELAGMYHYNMDGKPKQNVSLNEEPLITNETSKRGFFQIYTPTNIIAEIKHRLTKK
jgi:ectoine hydroxylase-related dioxygenase (phytanoyl-CoA dioxygenase family)